MNEVLIFLLGFYVGMFLVLTVDQFTILRKKDK